MKNNLQIELTDPNSENFKCPGSGSINWGLSRNWPQTPRVIVCVDVQSVSTPSMMISIARPLKCRRTKTSPRFHQLPNFYVKKTKNEKIFTYKMHQLVNATSCQRLLRPWVTLAACPNLSPRKCPSSLFELDEGIKSKISIHYLVNERFEFRSLHWRQAN